MMMRRTTTFIIITFLVICLAPSTALAEDASIITEYEREELARMLYGEDRGNDWSVEGVMRKAAVVQVALNRLDAWGGKLFGGSDAIVRHSQFHGYERDNPVQSWAMDVVRRVCDGWEAEQAGEINLYRVLPADYLYFAARRGVNRFRNAYVVEDATYLDFEDVPDAEQQAWTDYLTQRKAAS